MRISYWSSDVCSSDLPYDIPNVELSHVGEKCSFDAFLDKYGLGEDKALQQLAVIVRGADTSRLDLTPQSGGLFAISLGLSSLFPVDHEMLRHGVPMYDALRSEESRVGQEGGGPGRSRGSPCH